MRPSTWAISVRGERSSTCTPSQDGPEPIFRRDGTRFPGLEAVPVGGATRRPPPVVRRRATGGSMVAGRTVRRLCRVHPDGVVRRGVGRSARRVLPPNCDDDVQRERVVALSSQARGRRGSSALRGECHSPHARRSSAVSRTSFGGPDARRWSGGVGRSRPRYRSVRYRLLTTLCASRMIGRPALHHQVPGREMAVIFAYTRSLPGIVAPRTTPRPLRDDPEACGRRTRAGLVSPPDAQLRTHFRCGTD